MIIQSYNQNTCPFFQTCSTICVCSTSMLTFECFPSLFQSVMNRIHTISVPYAVMKACPMSWVQRVHIHKGLAIVKLCIKTDFF